MEREEIIVLDDGMDVTCVEMPSCCSGSQAAVR